MVVTGAVLLAACNGGDGTRPAVEVDRRPPVVRAMTFNILHGLFCPPGTDFCQAADRANLVAYTLAEQGCPELVGLQEVGSRQRELLPEAIAGTCGGRYELVFEPNPEGLPQTMALSTLPILEQGRLDLANVPWDAHWLRVESQLGPVEFLTAHFASDVNNPPCDEQSCPAVCPAGIETNECHAREVADFFASRPAGAPMRIVAGDLNADPGSATVATLIDAGFSDTWLLAGNDECQPATGAGCTAGRHLPDTPLDGLDVPDGRYRRRIDFVLAQPDGSCDLLAVAAVVGSGPLREPLAGLYWASDHAAVLTELTCSSPDDRTRS